MVIVRSVKIDRTERKDIERGGRWPPLFGTPVAAVLLAVTSFFYLSSVAINPTVALASVTACAVRIAITGSAPAFIMPDLIQPGDAALGIYI